MSLPINAIRKKTIIDTTDEIDIEPDYDTDSDLSDIGGEMEESNK